MKVEWAFKWSDYPYGSIRLPFRGRRIAPVRNKTLPHVSRVAVTPPLFVCGYCGRQKYGAVHHEICPLRNKGGK